MGLKVGIDFGTSNSGVAIYRGGRVDILPVDPKNVMPEVAKTILYITKDYKSTIGQEAVELYYRHNVNRIRRYVKKWVGEIDYRGADMHYVRDIYAYVDELMPGRLLQFIKTALRSVGYEGTQIFDRYYTLSDVIATYLSELKRRAEAVLNDKINAVTLGRPIIFSPIPEQDQKAETILRQAAYEAGFDQVDLEFEPVAAALYYEMTLDRPQNVLIFDFGGGTLDLTIMRLGNIKERKVFANGGIGIAGSDFDRAIIQKRMLVHFGKGLIDHRHDLLELVNTVPDWIALPELSTPHARLKLEQAILEGEAPARMKALTSLIFNDLAFSFYNTVEATKILLSSQAVATVCLKGKNLDVWELYSRYQFEKDIQEYKDQIERVLVDTIQASGLAPGQIDAVVKTGGSSNIPVFSTLLQNLFGSDRLKSTDVFNSVTAGLAIKDL